MDRIDTTALLYITMFTELVSPPPSHSLYHPLSLSPIFLFMVCILVVSLLGCLLNRSDAREGKQRMRKHNVGGYSWLIPGNNDVK